MRILIPTVEMIPPINHQRSLAEIFVQLASAMKREKAEVTFLTPYCGPVRGGMVRLARRLHGLAVPWQGELLELPLWEGALSGNVRLLQVEHPSFLRTGVFGDGTRDWPDNPQRFGLFCKAVAVASLEHGLRPDVIHLHDWPTGLVPYYLQRMRPASAERPATVFSLYNLAFQGHYGPEILEQLEIPPEDFLPDRLEYFGHLNFLKAGLICADWLVAMSRAHAREIQTPAGGFGMDGLLRFRSNVLSGIALGIDGARFNPQQDPHLAQGYTAELIGGKRVCKRALQDELGLPGRTDRPLVGCAPHFWKLAGVTSSQEQLLERLLGTGLQVVLLPAADDPLPAPDLSERYPEHFGLLPAGDVAAYHRLLAGADLLVVPCHFEPGSQPAQEALRYGTLPVIHGSGVLESGTEGRVLGFEFSGPPEAGLLGAIQRAATLFREQKQWRVTMLEGMDLDFSWNAAACSYLRLFQALTGNGQSTSAKLEV